MPHQSSIIVRSAAAVALLLSLAPAAHAATLYVANNGVDGALCGAQASPCRSISNAIANAAPGDTISVGPGKYKSDLDSDGILGEAGEETGSPGCGCMLSVNKPVIVVSSHGAASTVIDARTVDVATNVLLILDSGEFGRPGKGFTVTYTRRDFSAGIVIDSLNVKVRGNQVIGTRSPASGALLSGVGINALFGGPILIEGNQVTEWEWGIRVSGTGKTVRKNQVSRNNTGIDIKTASSSIVTGNIATANAAGIRLEGTASVVGNAVYGNNLFGFEVFGSSSRIERNNIFGNGSSPTCGLFNFGVSGLDATNNYWGAASGPGPNPADEVCNHSGGTTTVTPFATAPFTVRAPIRP